MEAAVNKAQGRADGEGIRQKPRTERDHRWPGTWICAPVVSESRGVSVRWPGFSQVRRTEFLWPPLPSNDRSHEMSAGRWVSGMVASARNSWGLAPAQKGG